LIGVDTRKVNSSERIIAVYEDVITFCFDCIETTGGLNVILDNLNTHKPANDRWLKSHPNVRFHFTPTHASWLNQIECWFSVLSRQALQGASFVGVIQLRQAIDNFISAYNSQAAPFEWRQEEIKQQPLRDNIVYLCK
jgi:DDE superfamily endonuclease